MKMSEITIQDLKDYARVEHSDEDNLFTAILLATKQYIKGRTGLTTEQCDEKDDLPIALMVLANEIYDNRAYSVENDKVNRVVDNIIDQYCVNLL